MHGPIIEGAVHAGCSGDMTPPARLAGNDGNVRAHVRSAQPRHPHVTRGEIFRIFARGMQDAARNAHTAQVGDRLREHGKLRRVHPVRRRIEPLRACDGNLVVHPAMRRIPEPRIAVLGGDVHAWRADHMLEILQPPGIGFTDRHCRQADRAAAVAMLREANTFVMRPAMLWAQGDNINRGAA